MKQKKWMVVGVVAVVAMSAVSARATARRVRIERFQYQAPAVGFFVAVPDALESTGALTCEPAGSAPGCVTVGLRPSERYLVIEATDVVGEVVGGIVFAQDNTPIGLFCTNYRHRIPVQGNAQVTIGLGNGTCPDGTASTVTSGTLKVTILR